MYASFFAHPLSFIVLSSFSFLANTSCTIHARSNPPILNDCCPDYHRIAANPFAGLRKKRGIIT
jgi:hypothetical protein